MMERNEKRNEGTREERDEREEKWRNGVIREGKVREGIRGEKRGGMGGRKKPREGEKHIRR